jgi:phenylalanyl-tRNA synthetase beta chain
MKIALEWLRQMVRIEADADEIAHRLTMGGLEVEDPAPVPAFTQVVAARVLQVERHPNADRLSVCRVDAGGPDPRTIVCGAPNVAPGLCVPCALPGAVLPGDFAIKISTVRGVRSEGMLCSAKELGLSEESSGLMLLDAGTVPGSDLRGVLGLDDPVFEIKTTPNRGDCLSVLGVARELAALSGTDGRAPALQPPPADPVAPNSDERLPVRVEASELCGRFSGRVLRGLDARAPTPAWMKRRLEQGGQRSVSALVDISNYVMLEIGQPSHVFDLNKVRGGLQVRWAWPGEQITLLNEQTVTLDPSVGVVADDGGAEAIAGIMGGLSTSVTLETTDVYLEAAFWWPESIQGRPRRFNFSTEAAHRFERGIDFARTVPALERLTQLIVQVCGTPATRIGPIDDIVARLPARDPVDLRPARLQRVLGVALTAEQVQDCLQRLSLPTVRHGDLFRVTPPSFRFDLQREEDLIEEVARIWGYDKLPAEPPLAPARMRARSEASRGVHDLRQHMAQSGYQEVINFSFVPDAWEADFGADLARSIRVLNPIAGQYSRMRSNLLSGLVANLRYNLNRQATRVRTFELARVFARDPQQGEGPEQVAGIAQPRHLAALAFGPAEEEQWGLPARRVDYFDVKGDLERLLFPHRARFVPPEAAATAGTLAAALHPGRCAAVLLGDEPIGWIGELHPRICRVFELPSAPLLFEVRVAPLLPVALPTTGEIPRFPALVRDIAVWIDSALRAGDVLDDLRVLAGREPGLAAVRDVRLFDVFRPAPESSESASAESASLLLIKEKSLAFRVVLQDTQRSLAESDADAARAAIVAHLLQRWGARVRQ